jgi:hypothetical protein
MTKIDIRLATYTLDEAAQSDFLMEHIGEVVRIARSVREIVPTARPLIRRIATREWDEDERERGRIPAGADGEPMPCAIEVDYDPIFAQFVFTLEHGPTADESDLARLSMVETPALRGLYWAAVQNSADAIAAADGRAHAIAERDKRLILYAITGRGEKVSG